MYACAFDLYKLAILIRHLNSSLIIRMEKLKQKVAILQENIETSKANITKTESEVNKKEEKIEELKETVESLSLQINTAESDFETADDELSGLKNERKKMTDDEEELDRNLRKLLHSTNLSKTGATGLQDKITKNKEKLALLQSEIEEKENTIEVYEQDLDMAEQNNSSLKEQLNLLETELVEATNVHQSISSSHVTTSGAGGSLRNQVAKRSSALEKRKREHEEMDFIVTNLTTQRDTIESDIDEATTKLDEIKAECSQLFEELETI